VLAALARFHAHRQLAAEHLSCFDQTANGAELDAAERELKAGLKEWQELSAWTTGLYPMNMVYGPEDTGHWKDKLPYLRHDLEAIRERRWLLERFGTFRFGFDFGAGPIMEGFSAIRNETRYSEARGYGWIDYDNVWKGDRAVGDNLLRDYCSGKGDREWAVRLPNGQYRVTVIMVDMRFAHHTGDLYIEGERVQVVRHARLDLLLSQPLGQRDFDCAVERQFAFEDLLQCLDGRKR